jgi:hypothetical protein
MTQYVLVYVGGDQPASPEEGKQHFAKYMQWIESLGKAAISPANPLKHTQTVGPDGTVTAGGSSGMSGYTIVETRSLDEALEMAKSCPFLEIGGSLEVSQLMQMPS